MKPETFRQNLNLYLHKSNFNTVQRAWIYKLVMLGYRLGMENGKDSINTTCEVPNTQMD